MSQLTEVWESVKYFVRDGYSVIPVRDKPEGDKLAKTPYSRWKEFQQRRADETELFTAMDKFGTEAVGIVTGAISGNLEAIDVDSKYYPGCDAALFKSIKDLYPVLWEKLRIHKSPNNGYHILYRVATGTIPGNLKLAARKPTDEENNEWLLTNKKPRKEINFLETRGEGGYVLAPPSVGYRIHKDNPAPLISWEDRCGLINLCRAMHEVPPEAPKEQKEFKGKSQYDESPFAHYNRTADPTPLLTAIGWSFHSENSKYIYYIRPGKEKGISASFNLEKRVLYIFTSSTDFDEAKGYFLSQLYTEHVHNGDWKSSYAGLVHDGYGQVRREVERQVVQQLAGTGKTLPSNFSAAAVSLLQSENGRISDSYPHGMFWLTGEKGIYVDRDGLYQVAHGLGFRLYKGDIVRVSDGFINPVNVGSFFDVLVDYIQEDDADIYKDILNKTEAFFQTSGKFSISRLRELEVDNILKDTKNESYKLYKNGVLKITAEGYVLQPYSAYGGFLIWHNRIQPREFIRGEIGGLYSDYLTHAIRYGADSKLTSYIHGLIGYLTHEFKDETTPYIIAMVEEVIDPKDGGGAGKNMFCNLLKYATTYRSIPGASVKYTTEMIQTWTGERLFCFSDVEKNFNWSFLKNMASDNVTIKRLYKDEVTYSVEELPKFIVLTNYSYEVVDGGVKRRLRPLEFTNFFTEAGGIDKHYNGKMFPHDWQQGDWIGYDNFIALSIQMWLASGCKLGAGELSDTGKEKQFHHMYGIYTSQFIEEHIDGWMESGSISNTEFKKQLDSFYNENNIIGKFQPSMAKINAAIESYCTGKGIDYRHDKTIRDMYQNVIKVREFKHDKEV